MGGCCIRCFATGKIMFTLKDAATSHILGQLLTSFTHKCLWLFPPPSQWLTQVVPQKCINNTLILKKERDLLLNLLYHLPREKPNFNDRPLKLNQLTGWMWAEESISNFSSIQQLHAIKEAPCRSSRRACCSLGLYEDNGVQLASGSAGS